MNNTLLRLYYRLPAPARNVAASLRGYQLRRWRYSPETERLVEESAERERWSVGRWKNWQEERLAFILRRAATRVPYYREQWAERRRRGDQASWEQLENWPVLEKESLRKIPKAFVADDCQVSKLYHEHTSGTSGTSLSLWRGREMMQMRYALHDARWVGWHGVSHRDRWAMIGGQLVTPAGRRHPPFWVWNKAANQLYMSAYHLAPDLIPHYLDALAQYEVKYLFGYTSALAALAQGALRLGRNNLRLTVAITNAEPLFDHQRRAIADAFQCPVRETYGMTEFVAAAGECQEGRMHLWPEVGVVEAFDNDQPAGPGRPGDFVCTGLLNADMLLIRYRVGDRGILASDDEQCGCGRSLPLLTSVEGRVDDVLYTADGRAVGRLDPVFKSHLPIREAQIIQESLQRVRVRYVPTAEYTPEAGRSIVERLQARMGAIEVVLEQVEELPRTSNGKFRAVICNLTPEQKMSVKTLSAETLPATRQPTTTP